MQGSYARQNSLSKKVSWLASLSSSPCSEESETPRSRTGLGSGISLWSKATDRRSRSLRLETATGTDLLRVMISKSLNFTFNVTVRPRLPLPSQ
jgi:hypothetical protein